MTNDGPAGSSPAATAGNQPGFIFVAVYMLKWCLLLTLLLSCLAFGQQATPQSPQASLASPGLSPDRIQELIRQTADNDLENDKRQHNYTYTQRDVQRRLDGKGQVKSTETKTYEVMELYGEQVQKLVAKDDKPLPEQEAKKEDERIQKLLEKRKNESERERNKRLEKEEKERAENRKFVLEVADAYDFRFVGIETLEGRPTYVIDGDPKPGYEPQMKEAKILPKFRFRAWIDTEEVQWKKLDIQCIDTVSFGLVLARVHKGSRILIEQTRINNEIWLPQHVAANVDVRVALVKDFDVTVDSTFSKYEKFRTETKVVPLADVQEQKQSPSTRGIVRSPLK